LNIILTDEQNYAIKLIKKWFNSYKKHIPFVLAGYAGTGKSTVVSKISEELNISDYNIRYVAYTGKAALVMKNKGLEATTIHSLIYEPREDEKGDIYFKKLYKLASSIKLIIVDEASMIGKELQKDLESFRIPILYVGDSGQLPPISKDIISLMNNANFTLQKIHRQALDNPIIWLSNEVRQGKYIKPGRYGESVLKTNNLHFETLTKSNQILCGKNATRININNQMRKGYGFNNIYPEVNDKLICLRNNNLNGLINGMLGKCVNFNEKKSKLNFMSDENELFKNLKIHKGIFTNEDIKYQKDIESFDYGYTITTHKCLSGDTFIFTDKGIKQLIDLEKTYKTTQVFNGETLETPTNFIDNGISDCKEILTKKGYNITPTLDHGLDVLDNDGYIKRKNVVDIKENDVLVLKCNQNIYANTLSLPTDWNIKETYNAFNSPIIMSKDFAKFLGYMVADGTVSKKSIKFYNRYEKVIFDFKRISENLFGCMNSKISMKYSDYFMIEINSLDIQNFCKKIKGIQDHEKFVPDCILSADKEYQIEFLKSLFENDMINRKKDFLDHTKFESKSKYMIDQIRMMLLNMGIIWTYNKIDNEFHVIDEEIPNISYIIKKIFTKYNISNNPFQTSLTRDNVNLTKLREILQYIEPYIKDDEDYNYLKNISKGEIFFDKIISMNNIKCHTYCLEMEKSHKFLQNGFCGWNSQGSEFEKVILFEERLGDNDFHRKWLYTGITRAKNKLIIFDGIL